MLEIFQQNGDDQNTDKGTEKVGVRTREKGRDKETRMARSNLM